MYDKIIFEEELNLISNQNLKESLNTILDNIPNYFWSIPASSSGKYHPKQDLGIGGLVRHTKTVIRVGLDLLRAEVFVEDNDYNRDVIITSCLLHDICKNGIVNENETIAEHPLIASSFVSSWLSYSVSPKIITNVCYCIESHMGKWNKDKDGNEILPIPEIELEKLVHLADYIASRKYINYFDRNGITWNN